MTDTISDRLRKYRAGVIWTIKEDIILYLVLIALVLSWDILISLLISAGFYAPTHEAIHPFKFGIYQLLVLTLGSLQLLRKIFDLRKYS